jgi:hypothetical protein
MFLVVLIRIGYAYHWTGFGQSKVNQAVQPAKTLWDWLDLLIVPAVLAIGGYLFTRSENRSTQAAAERRAQDDALQAYLDGMSHLLTEKDLLSHKAEPGDRLSSVARAWTLTVLPRLDGDRKARVVQFLYEAGLIAKDRPVLDLSEADLSEASLGGANLSGTNLSGTNLLGANLGLTLVKVDDVGGLKLPGPLGRHILLGANLSGADLMGADLRAAHLATADLSGADLSGADLSGANLGRVKGFTNGELVEQTDLLDGATMPNTQKYEEWLETAKIGWQGWGKDEENS